MNKNENEKIIEVAETSETKGKEVVSKIKNWFGKNGKKIAVGAGIVITGIASYVIGKASTYTEFEEIEISDDDVNVVDDNSVEDTNNEE